MSEEVTEGFKDPRDWKECKLSDLRVGDLARWRGHYGIQCEGIVESISSDGRPIIKGGGRVRGVELYRIPGPQKPLPTKAGVEIIPERGLSFIQAGNPWTGLALFCRSAVLSSEGHWVGAWRDKEGEVLTEKLPPEFIAERTCRMVDPDRTVSVAYDGETR